MVECAQPHALNRPEVDGAVVIFCQCLLARKEELEKK